MCFHTLILYTQVVSLLIWLRELGCISSSQHWTKSCYNYISANDGWRREYITIHRLWTVLTKCLLLATIHNHNWHNVFQVTVREIHELVSNHWGGDGHPSCAVPQLRCQAGVQVSCGEDKRHRHNLFFILLHYAHSIPLTIYLDTGTGKHRQIVNVSEMSESKGADHCTTMLGLYVFTGEDVTSAFKGKGKVGPLKKLQNHNKYHIAFRWECFLMTVSAYKYYRSAYLFLNSMILKCYQCSCAFFFF